MYKQFVKRVRKKITGQARKMKPKEFGTREKSMNL